MSAIIISALENLTVDLDQAASRVVLDFCELHDVAMNDVGVVEAAVRDNLQSQLAGLDCFEDADEIAAIREMLDTF